MTTKNANEYKSLDDQIIKVQGMMEKRITELSNYVEKRLAQLEKMMQETAIDEVAELSNRIGTIADAMIENELENEKCPKKDECVVNAVTELNMERAEDIKLDIENKMDEKLDKFMQDKVKGAFEAAFTSFSEVMGERVMLIEGELAKLSKANG